MNNFTFYSPTEFVFGKGTENQVGELACKHGATNVLLVYGCGSVVRSGLLGRVKDALGKAGIPFVELGGVQPNPVDSKVYEGISLARREGVDMVLAVGGGSVIDTAKAIAAGVPYDGDFWDFYIQKARVRKALKVAVVLTIPAAGSEGSGNSVITKVATLQKLSIRACGIAPPVFFDYESRTDLHAASLSDRSRHCRHDGSYHGALFHEHCRHRDSRPPV